MKILRTNTELKNWRDSLSRESTLGFVPTMGALHDGHLSLVQKAKESCDTILVSIFVNPLQFNDQDDFKNYPKTLEEDLELLKKAEASAVWLPEAEDLYPHGMGMKIVEEDLSKRFCGLSRPGHFEGVLTIVMKLFQLVKPQKAFFGEKDFQQLQLIRKMVDEFFLEIEVVPAPTLREPSGLALSSRNLRLTPEEKERAPLFYQTLKNSSSAEEAVETLRSHHFKVDYVEDFNQRRFGAVWLGSVRLIDNVEL